MFLKNDIVHAGSSDLAACGIFSIPEEGSGLFHFALTKSGHFVTLVSHFGEALRVVQGNIFQYALWEPPSEREDGNGKMTNGFLRIKRR